MTEPRQRDEADQPVRRTNWTIVALIGGLILLAIVVGYFATSRNSDQDKLTKAQLTATTATKSREKLCASGSTYDLIKRELFRRAAQLRGNDQAAYDRLASFAVARMENPVMESEDSSTGAVNCSGSLSLDLPPGVAAIGGRRSLTSDVDYSVQQAADGSGPVVLLRNADAIITSLATLARSDQPPAQPPVSPPSAPAAILVAPETPQPKAVPPMPPAVPTAPPVVARTIAARPSFNCANARTSGEAAVCSDSGLAALDRNMAVEYGHAFAVASPGERDLLRRTGHRFYAYRDRCQSRQCIADAYAGRIREIRDIIAERWQSPQ